MSDLPAITWPLVQKGIYWEQDGLGDFSRPTFKEAVEVNCRWDDDAQKFIAEGGREKVSRASVMVDRVMKAGDYLHPTNFNVNTPAGNALADFVSNGGDVNDPVANSDSGRIEAFKKNPSVDGTESLYTAML